MKTHKCKRCEKNETTERFCSDGCALDAALDDNEHLYAMVKTCIAKHLPRTTQEVLIGSLKKTLYYDYE